MRRVSLITCTVAVVAGSCGGGSASSSTPTRPDAGSSPTVRTGPTPAETAADLKLAKAMIPMLSDFPTGWARDLSSNSDSSDTCKVDNGDLTRTAAIGSPNSIEFKESDTTELAASSAVWRTESQSRVAYVRATAIKQARCRAKYLEGLLRQRSSSDSTATVGSASLSDVSFPRVGEESKVYRIEIPTQSNGLSFPLFIDLLVYRVGRGTGVLAGLNIGAPFDQQFLAHMGSILAKREAQVAAPATV